MLTYLPYVYYFVEGWCLTYCYITFIIIKNWCQDNLKDLSYSIGRCQSLFNNYLLFWLEIHGYEIVKGFKLAQPIIIEIDNTLIYSIQSMIKNGCSFIFCIDNWCHCREYQVYKVRLLNQHIK
jgi:hypothetical protein